MAQVQLHPCHLDKTPRGDAAPLGGHCSGTRRRWLPSALLGILVAAALGALAVRRAEPRRLLDCLGEVRLGFLAPIFLSLAALCVLRALRWAWILRPVRCLSAGQIFPALMVGALGDQCLPTHLGELLRVWAIRREHGVGVAAALSSIVVERVLDVLTILLLFAGVLLFLPGTLDLGNRTSAASVLSVGVAIAVVLILVVLVVLFVLQRSRRGRGILERLLALALRVLPRTFRCRIEEAFRTALPALSALRSLRRFLLLLALSLGQWVANGLLLYFTAASLSSGGATPPPQAALLLTVAVVIGGLLPTAPGYLGTLQLCFVVALSPFGVPREAAIAASLYAVLAGSLPVVIVGGFCFLRLRGSSMPEAMPGGPMASAGLLARAPSSL
jgi:uncharacterized protein (TIRG00374 family)